MTQQRIASTYKCVFLESIGNIVIERERKGRRVNYLVSRLSDQPGVVFYPPKVVNTLREARRLALSMVDI